MKTKRIKAIAALTLLMGSAGLASAASKPKTAAQTSTIVDSGTFAVMVRGAKVATETFQIEQSAGGASRTHSELRSSGGANADQISDMELTATGELSRYQWQAPGEHSSLTVEPNEEFLVEHLSYPGKPDAKDQNAAQQHDKTGMALKTDTLPHILPRTTPVLDDNFFSHRELLLWRYLAGACGTQNGQLQCKFRRENYGVLVPNQHSAASVTIEYSGNKGTTVAGAARIANVYKLMADDVEWNLLVDPSNMKVLRIEIPSEQTEIVRE